MLRSLSWGVLASVFLLGAYFVALSLISGWDYTLAQFYQYYSLVVALALGFGLQVGLYKYIKGILHSGQNTGKVLGITGTTSTAAMVSCCAHYAVNLIPILGITGLVSFTAQYQVELFWAGLGFNLLGICFLGSKVYKLKKAIC